MGRGKRVLFLGETGVSKKEALTNLSKYCDAKFYRSSEVIDFDHHLLEIVNSQWSFLDTDIRTQRRDWNEAWDDCFSKRIQPLLGGEKDIFLGLHGCYTRSQYGSRCVLDLKRIAKFEPTLIVTLIADVYDMWWRTESRAGGEAWRGQPTLEHLIAARRSEVMVADMIALECADRPRSLVVAVGHPCDTMAKCIFSERPRIVYLSFPISEPRRLEAKGDMTGIEEVSQLIAKAHAYQKADPNLAFICPLAIDELPFSSALAQLPGSTAEFDRDKLRWNLSRFWPPDERMAQPATPHGPFKLDDVRNAAGSILTDVGWRDFRLAEQADKLAVFNPLFPGRTTATGGVANEVAHASRFGRPIYVYQDPNLDPKGLCENWLRGYGAGTMGQSPSGQLIVRKPTIDELFAAL